MKIEGEVHQVKPNNSSEVFLNIREVADDCGIDIWGSCYFRPTYLFRGRDQSGEFHLIQFRDKESANKWIEENKEYFKISAKIGNSKNWE